MSAVTDTINNLTLKLGNAAGFSGQGQLAGILMSFGQSKLLLLLLVLPIGSVMLGLWLILHRFKLMGRTLWRWIAVKPLVTVLVIASALWFGYLGWRVSDRWQGHYLSLAAGSRTAESYKLARALQNLTTLHSPRIRVAILEIENAAGDDGVLEKGVVQLAIAPGNLPIGPSARSVAELAGASPLILLARYDVDEQVVRDLAQALTKFSAELTSAKADGNKTASQPATATVQKPQAKSAAPLHPGAAAFYDWDQTPFVIRYATLITFVVVGLVLLGLWIWQWRGREQRRQEAPAIRPLPPAGPAPWTFARILEESIPTTAAPLHDTPKRSRFRLQRRRKDA